MAAFRFSCPSCQGVLQGDDAMRGKQVRCPTCQAVFSVPGPGAPPESCWHVARNKSKEGPYTKAQLKQLAARGQLRPQDMVIREDEGKWLPAASLQGLFPAVTKPPLAIFVGPTPRGGSTAPVASPLGAAATSIAAGNTDGQQPISLRRRVRWPWIGGAGAAVVLLAGVGVLALTGVFSPRDDSQQTGPGEKQAGLPPGEGFLGGISLVQFRLDEVAADGNASTRPPDQTRGSSRAKAVAWLRANNAFGPKHRMVDQLAKALDEVDGGKAFFLRLGTRLVKSRKPTLLAGRNGAFQAFEVAPELAGKWIPELLTEFKTTSALDEVVEPVPAVILDKLKFDKAFGLDGRSKLTGSVTYQKLKALEGTLGLRLTYMAGEYTHTRYHRFGQGLARDRGTLDFSFPPLHVKDNSLGGTVPVFVELCSFKSPDQRGKVVVLSNSVPALLYISDRGDRGEEEEQQPPPAVSAPKAPTYPGTLVRFIDRDCLKASAISLAIRARNARSSSVP